MITMTRSTSPTSHAQVVVIAVPTRLEALAAEFAFAVKQAEIGDLRDIALSAAKDLGSALARRSGNVLATARNVALAAGGEVIDATRAWRANRFVDHATDRGEAASNDLAKKYQNSKQAGVTFYETLRSDPVEQLTRLPVMVIAGLLAAGGIDGDGGVPDMDLLAGIGYHRSPFTHSIIAGAVLETAVLTLIRVVEKVHHRLPLNHDPIWDEFTRHSTAVLDAAGRGASAGIAYHLLVDGIAQPGAYHGLPIELPIEAHQGLFVVNAGAEAQDAVVRPKSGIDLRDDHKALLEIEFALTANLRSHMMPAHVATMTSCGNLLKALADGATEPYTAQQRQFVEVAKGRRSPEREVEHAWLAYVRALEMARC